MDYDIKWMKPICRVVAHTGASRKSSCLKEFCQQYTNTDVEMAQRIEHLEAVNSWVPRRYSRTTAQTLEVN